MKKRILSIICIIFLMFTVTAPICSNYFVYAEETPQEQLTTEEIIEAGLIAYLNQRKAWIVNDTGDSIFSVKAVMKSWINSYEFWRNTDIGSAVALASNIIIKYSPFRVQLKGPAVRAFNDLYDWLVDNGKLGNLQNSNGGETSDNLYEGYLIGNDLFYIFNGPIADNVGLSANNVKVGTPVNGVTGDFIFNTLQNSNPGKDLYDAGWASITKVDVTIQYSSNISVTRQISRVLGASGNMPNAGTAPFLFIQDNEITMHSKNYGSLGCACWYQVEVNSSDRFYYGLTYYNPIDNKYYAYAFGEYIRDDNIKFANVNFDTDNFIKTDPTPPEEGEEEDLTPINKTTGDTFNTYNEYITNYVTKNTVINQTTIEEPGGTEPPWNDQDTTINPDGNGGFDLSLPDLTIPDLNIDWNINGLKEKFPFSIPWDLLAFFTVLNAEPETPSIEAQIDLGIVNWDIDWDLHNFDALAVLLRNLEFIGFCLALILITRSIIKG